MTNLVRTDSYNLASHHECHVLENYSHLKIARHLKNSRGEVRFHTYLLHYSQRECCFTVQFCAAADSDSRCFSRWDETSKLHVFPFRTVLRWRLTLMSVPTHTNISRFRFKTHQHTYTHTHTQKKVFLLRWVMTEPRRIG